MSSPYFISGLTRHVKPYIYEFKTYAKGRWIGKNIIDILTTEFGGFDMNYWKLAIQDTNILVNGNPVTENYIIRNSDLLLHKTHRHEPPVFGEITLVGETSDLIAVCKPASMPMHPCGSYKLNTLLSILKEEPIIPNQPQLFTVHRLDRVTSGLVILAKTSEVANNISKEIRSNQTEKVYLARVKGRFPASLDHLQHLSNEQLFQPTESEEVKKELRKEGIVNSSLSKKRTRRNEEHTDNIEPSSKLQCTESKIEIEIGLESGSRSELGSNTQLLSEDTKQNNQESKDDKIDYSGYGYSTTGELIIRYPIAVVSHREGIHKCDLSGKPSLSGFKLLGYREDDDTSLIECYPYTGRTHQLRLHLQLVGNPIANDPCYGGTLFYGQKERIEIAKQVASKLLRLKEVTGGRLVSNLPHLSDLLDLSSNTLISNESKIEEESLTSNDTNIMNSKRLETETEEEYLIRNCRYCKQTDIGGITCEEQALVHCDSIWLHAIRYRGSNWKFETPPPSWGKSEEFISI